PPEPPPALRTPTASVPPAPPEKSVQFNMAIEALSQLAKETEGIAPSETEREVPLAEKSGAGKPGISEAETTQASDERAMAVERQVGSLAEQVRSAHQAVDALVEKLHEFQGEWENEIARVRRQAEQASAQALESSLEEAREQVKRDA